ncbi:MAG TPA: GAF domain-containing protein [Novosphingobium sp.]|nr:GAF domain-containing protein [Novosphingobium sp.]HZV10854.1 GAF domain-containing protein [Novosphingobium sp.]
MHPDMDSPTLATLTGLIAAPGQPDALLTRMARMLMADPGYAMLTILLYDVAGGRGRRIYSTDEVAYPTGAFKPIPMTDWADQVLVRHQPFIADTVADFRPHYGDWAKLEAMGLISGLNTPIIVDGVAIGSVNFTARSEGYYTPARVEAARRCGALAAIALLLEARGAA